MKSMRDLLLKMTLPFYMVFVGLYMNYTTIHVNGGMPVLNLDYSYGKWIPLVKATKYKLLSDIFVLHGYTFSAGDVVQFTGLFVGICICIIWLFTRKKIVKKIS